MSVKGIKAENESKVTGGLQILTTEPPKVPVKENPNKDKLCIMGFSPTSFQDGVDFIQKHPGCEVWCMNMFYVTPNFPFSMVTRWFEFHHVPTNESVRADNQEGRIHRQNLRGIPCPIYVQNKERDWADFPQEKLVEFPAKEIVEFFPRKYFSSTPSWLLAYAFMLGVQEMKQTGKFKWNKICMAGVDMMQGWAKRAELQPDGTSKVVDVVSNEYAMQRPSVEWVCGMFDNLKALGIDCELIIPLASSLFQMNNLYGFEEYFGQGNILEMKRKKEVRLKWMQERLNNLQNNYNQIAQRNQQELSALQNQMLNIQGSKSELEITLSDFA